mmetsp:Transcript_7303/g.7522  ORF Transcript_7303/g.7522 Transcript_7303/m.7522 type:complete len:440 (+) Transcript_7303:82-1401(+)
MIINFLLCIFMITSPRIMSNESRGIIMCSGKGLMIHTLVLIRQTRRMLSINATSSESVSILVAHCNELVDLHDRAVRREGGDGLMDICPGVPPVKESKLRDGSGSISGPRSRSHLSGTQKQNSSSSLSASDISRRRSFFCKPAALLLSPFTHTMLVDHDVIWFKNPALLWDAPGYVHTGALYFLDRFIPYDNRYKDGIRGASALVSQYWGRNISLSLSLSLSRTVTYWRHHYNISSVRPKHVQDSSVVMINREKHKGTLSTISSLLSNFTVGYGDKEIYWLASTIANQSFAFEPYWPGVYGDCGAVFHFDPRYFPPSIYPFPSLSSSSSRLFSKYQAMTLGLCEILSDLSLVSFLPLNIDDVQTVGRVLAAIDRANGYSFASVETQRFLSTHSNIEDATRTYQSSISSSRESLDHMFSLAAQDLETTYSRSLEIQEKYS